MGELHLEPFQFAFNGFLKVAFQGSRITSDAGLLLVRELDERLGLATLISEHLSDSRQGLNTQFGLVDLLRQSVYSRLAGYEDLNDAGRVSADPTFRLIGSPKRWDRGGALTSTLHWFETELLTRAENLVGLTAVNRELLAQAEQPIRAGRIVLDMDSSESPVHGEQEGSAYNGHFAIIQQHASPHARFLQRTLFRSQLQSAGAALDGKPTGAPASRVFLRHRSTRVPCLRRFVALRPRVSLLAPAAPRSSAACRRTAAGSDDLPPAGASSTAHASPAGPQFSRAGAGDS